LSREIDEELESHIEEAIEQGRDPAEARRAFGSTLRRREESRDIRVIGWLDSLRADTVFGWRQILKKKVTSAAAILSLALAIGACTSAFRLIDARCSGHCRWRSPNGCTLSLVRESAPRARPKNWTSASIRRSARCARR
jgi:hypothetical protein